MAGEARAKFYNSLTPPEVLTPCHNHGTFFQKMLCVGFTRSSLIPFSSTIALLTNYLILVRSTKFKQPERDSVTTINEDGSRYFIHVADVSGQFTFWRRVVGIFLLAIFIALPQIPINGYPAVFLDTEHQRFHLFGITLAAQDLWLMFFGITGLGFALFFITALFGRLWCGWACPQTVFLDHLIRRIERLVEGDAPARRRLAEAPWTVTKVTKRLLKHSLYLAVAAVIAHLFLAYFISIPKLWEAMQAAPWQHWQLFTTVLVLTGLLYLDFAWFREQFCIILCPYGRFQSALIDEHSMIIGYDEKRGEPRGKATDPNNGDCIDCRRCVQVCPTGIDIRHGLQMECIGCSNCIDACDEVMTRLKRPKGLIRYDSMEGFNSRATKWLRPRTLIYTLLFVIGASTMTWAFSGVRPATLVVTRMPGAPYYIQNGVLRNQYNVRVINKKPDIEEFKIVADPKGFPLSAAGADVTFALAGGDEIQRTIVFTMPAADFEKPFEVSLYLETSDGRKLVSKPAVILGPDPATL